MKDWNDGDVFAFQDEMRLYANMLISNELGFLILFDGASTRVPTKMYRILFEKGRLPTVQHVASVVTKTIEILKGQKVSLEKFDLSLDPITSQYYTEAGYPTVAVFCQCHTSFPMAELQLALEDALKKVPSTALF